MPAEVAMELTLEELRNKSFSEFTRSIVKQLSHYGEVTRITTVEFKLNINDKVITSKEEIDSSNGRYFFKKNIDTYIPCAGSPGVYIFFNKSDVALYVGKSDVAGGIGRRVWAHIGKYVNGEYPNLEFPEAEYIVVIPFTEAPYLSSAFEGYLLNNHKFKYNTQKN